MPTRKPTTRKRRLSVEIISQALWEAFGNVTVAASILECERAHLNKRVLKEPELSQARADGLSRLVDAAESALLSKIREGDTASIIFALKTQGRGQGWEEKPKVVVHQSNVTNVEKPKEVIERWRAEL